jgi:hypothetical protein
LSYRGNTQIVENTPISYYSRVSLSNLSSASDDSFL